MISDVDIIWITDPESGWELIGHQHSESLDGRNTEIIFENILGFDSIFQEICMTPDVVGDIVFDMEVVGSVDG